GSSASSGLTLLAGGTTATGSITLTSAVSVGHFLAQAGSTGAINLSFAGTVVTTAGGGQVYKSPVTLQADTTLTDTGNGPIMFDSQVTGGANSLVLNSGSGAQTLNGVTTSGNLTLNTTGTVILND